MEGAETLCCPVTAPKPERSGASCINAAYAQKLTVGFTNSEINVRMYVPPRQLHVW
ncbi:hypothetical protein M9458_050992, partial [Cirrhinus mrigala]